MVSPQLILCFSTCHFERVLLRRFPWYGEGSTQASQIARRRPGWNQKVGQSQSGSVLQRLTFVRSPEEHAQLDMLERSKAGHDGFRLTS